MIAEAVNIDAKYLVVFATSLKHSIYRKCIESVKIPKNITFPYFQP